jgi:tetratricopeptide (TPR) repeat protein
MISDVLRGERRDPRMRALAMEALGKTGGLVYAETFYNYMQPRNEPDPEVREVAWQTLRAALSKGTDQQLANAARLFKSDPEHHVFVAQTMADRFRQRNNLDEWAFQMRNVADDEMNLQPRRPADAAAHYEQALKYWLQTNKGDPQTVDELTQKVVQARLAAAQYAQAAAFAQEAITRQGAVAKEAVGRVIKNEADNLRTIGEYRSAVALIDAALKMNPPLEPRHRGDLEKIRADIEGAAPPGTGNAPPAGTGNTAPAGTGNTAPGQ